MDPGTSTLQQAVTRASEDGGSPVLLVRHGRTAYNAQRKLVGRRDVPLDELGREQARKLRAALAPLAPSRVVVSPLQRAHGTLDGLGALTVDPLLAEVDHGEIEGLQEREFLSRYGDFLERWQRDPEGIVIPGGESLGQAAERAYPALVAHAEACSPPRPVVICSHQMVIATLLCRCLGLPLTRYRDHTCRNTAVNVLRYHGGSWTLLLADDLSHLDDQPSS